jgi:predicted transcriptional regulator
MKTIEGGEPFKWEALVPHIVHPMKVAIIEAMAWIGRPLSASELDKVFDSRFGVSQVSYHVRTLAEAGVIRKVRQEQVRGSIKTFFAFAVAARGTAPPPRSE